MKDKDDEISKKDNDKNETTKNTNLKWKKKDDKQENGNRKEDDADDKRKKSKVTGDHENSSSRKTVITFTDEKWKDGKRCSHKGKQDTKLKKGYNVVTDRNIKYLYFINAVSDKQGVDSTKYKTGSHRIPTNLCLI